VSDSTNPPEYLDQGAPVDPDGRRRKGLVLGTVGVVAAGAIGAAAWGVTSFLSGGGPGAAEALPDTVLAYASIDLDPSAGQKIEAVKTFNKFPGLKKQLDIGSRDDLRKLLFDKIEEGGDCPGLDYDSDVKPWLGDKAAIAAMPSTSHGADPIFALQSKDDGKAVTGLKKLFSTCSPDETYGYAVSDGYLLVAEKQSTVDQAVKDAKSGTLADDASYQSEMGKLGSQGIVSFYVSPKGPQALFDGLASSMLGQIACTEVDPSSTQACTDPQGKMNDAFDQVQSQLKNFKGAAGTLRFSGGGVELAAVGTGLPNDLGSASATRVGNLPTSTVAALGVTLPDGYFDTMLAQLRRQLGDQVYDRGVQELESRTGLKVPDDLETLLGGGLVAAIDGSTDINALVEQEDPTLLDAGVRLHGDASAIKDIVDKLVGLAGPEGARFVKVAADSDDVAVALNDDYADSLLKGGSLGSSDRFTGVVPESDRASSVLFLDFDGADHWFDTFVDKASDGDADVVANTKPLGAFGLSSWFDGDDAHVLLKLSTD
jgi:Protein of unknown function (DUF3352)